MKWRTILIITLTVSIGSAALMALAGCGGYVGGHPDGWDHRDDHPAVQVDIHQDDHQPNGPENR
jgi:hypothetical protein